MWTTRTVPTFGTPEYWQFFGGQPLTALYDLGIHLVLPVFTLVLVNIAFDSRFIRASMLNSLNQDFVKTARAKGVPEPAVIFKHALRNALLPVVTNIGLDSVSAPLKIAGCPPVATLTRRGHKLTLRITRGRDAAAVKQAELKPPGLKQRTVKTRATLRMAKLPGKRTFRLVVKDAAGADLDAEAARHGEAVAVARQLVTAWWSTA